MGIRHGSRLTSVPWIQVRESEKAKTTEEAGDRRLTRKNHRGLGSDDLSRRVGKPQMVVILRESGPQNGL